MFVKIAENFGKIGERCPDGVGFTQSLFSWIVKDNSSR